MLQEGWGELVGCLCGWSELVMIRGAALGAVALVLPAAASAHAYLVKTVPPAGVTRNAPPPAVALTFDEAVEPRVETVHSDHCWSKVTNGNIDGIPSQTVLSVKLALY